MATSDVHSESTGPPSPFPIPSREDPHFPGGVLRAKGQEQKGGGESGDREVTLEDPDPGCLSMPVTVQAECPAGQQWLLGIPVPGQ